MYVTKNFWNLFPTFCIFCWADTRDSIAGSVLYAESGKMNSEMSAYSAAVSLYLLVFVLQKVGMGTRFLRVAPRLIGKQYPFPVFLMFTHSIQHTSPLLDVLSTWSSFPTGEQLRADENFSYEPTGRCRSAPWLMSHTVVLGD